MDIERAMKNDYSQDARKRNLQLEAKAHIVVQKWIDSGGLKGGLAVKAEGICEIHRRFCELLPEDLLWVEDPASKERLRVGPGELRKRDVQVGTHVAVSPGALPRFLERFAQVYGNIGKTESIISTAAAHHRLLWIHPFMDVNGRVARLMSHAMMLDLLDTGAVGSVARGLARHVSEYKTLLAACDMTRRSDLDRRGTLREEALAEFTRFFLTVCIDQIDFMESLVQPDRLRARILLRRELFLPIPGGRKRKSGWGNCPPSRPGFSKRSSIAATCPVATPAQSSAPVNDRRAALSRPSSKSRCSYPTAPVRRSALPSRPLRRRVGCGVVSGEESVVAGYNRIS